MTNWLVSKLKCKWEILSEFLVWSHGSCVFGHVLCNSFTDYQKKKKKSLVPVADSKGQGSGNQLIGTKRADFLVNWLQANIWSYTSKNKEQVLILGWRNLREKMGVESAAAGSLRGKQLKANPIATPRPGHKFSPSVWEQQTEDSEDVTGRLNHISTWHWRDHFWNSVSCLMPLLKIPVDKLERVQGRVTRMITL